MISLIYELNEVQFLVIEEVWVEKWRPKVLEEVAGQKEVVERLKSYVKAKNLPHMIFAGPAGTGKTTCSSALARELFGENWRANFLELNASVTPDTPIIIKRDGNTERTTIGELAKEHFKNNESKYVYPKSIEVLSIDKNLKIKFLPIKNISKHKVNAIAKIKFEGGYVKTTLDHSVVIIDKKGNLRDIKVSKLKKGDLLITFRTTLEGHRREIDLSKQASDEFIQVKYKNKIRLLRNPTLKKVLKKTKLNKSLAWLFGSYLAEGAIGFRNDTSGVAMFTYGYPQEYLTALKASSIISENFGLHTGTHTICSGSSGKESAIQLSVCSTQLARFFKENFYDKEVAKQIAQNKRVPNFIFNLPVEYRHAFLKGYMGDATGKWEGYVRYSSKSKETLIDVTWLGRISGLDTSYFETESRIVWKLPSYSYIKSEFIPSQPLINFLESTKTKIGFNWKYLLRHQLYSKKCKRVTKGLAKKIFDRIDELNLSNQEKLQLKNIKNLVYSDISVVPIKEIKFEDYNDYVYDVSVPGSEVFWGGTAPVLLHNSDERGIDVVRGKIKDFARTIPLGEVGFKIIFLDEADALTPDAQNALRRTMENFTATTRFILSCNYSSKIIDPIQSRCAIYRFRPLSQKEIFERLKFIAKNEKLNITNDAIDAIIYVSEGDMRRAINLLQAASSLGKKITAETIYQTAAMARPEEVKELIHASLKGDFLTARNKLDELLISYGMSGEDIIQQVHKEIFTLDIPEDTKVKLADKVGEYDFRIVEGANERIQLEALLAQIALIGETLGLEKKKK